MVCWGPIAGPLPKHGFPVMTTSSAMELQPPECTNSGSLEDWELGQLLDIWGSQFWVLTLRILVSILDPYQVLLVSGSYHFLFQGPGFLGSEG